MFLDFNFSPEDEAATSIHNAIVSSLGLKAILNTLKSYAIQQGCNYIKSCIGFEIVTNDYYQFLTTIEYLEKKSKHRIISKKRRPFYPYIDINSVVMLDKGTFAYVHGDNKVKGKYLGYVYVFGKNWYTYANKINNLKYINESSKHKYTTVYTIYPDHQDFNSWEGTRHIITSRSFDTLYLDNDAEAVIKGHLDKWIENKDLYTNRGIIFKTGILLYGHPGTGKSSIAAAIADYLDCDMIIVDSSSFKDLNVNELTSSINADNNMYVVVLDDIDVILSSRSTDGVSAEDKATISKLLGFLDSSNSPNNVVFVATTNYIELFDEAIRRPGRFDKVIEIENISKPTAFKMCRGFGLEYDDATIVIDSYDTDTINPADLQSRIVDRIRHNLSESMM